jgi:hypothetical protein
MDAPSKKLIGASENLPCNKILQLAISADNIS